MDLNKALQWMREKKVHYYTLGLIFALFLLLIFAQFFITALLIAAAAAAAVIVNAIGLRRSGFELITLATVLLGMAKGPKAGALIGLILVAIQIIAGGYINVYVLWIVPGYVLAGAVAGLLSGMAVSTVGIGITIGLNVVFIIFTMLFTPGALGRYIPYAILNVIINFILFSTIAPVLYQGLI